MSGLPINNRVDARQLVSFLTEDYSEGEESFLDSLNKNVGSFFMDNFIDYNLHFIQGFGLSRPDLCRLLRILTGYAFNNHYLCRIGVLESPACECGFMDQDLNHVL